MIFSLIRTIDGYRVVFIIGLFLSVGLQLIFNIKTALFDDEDEKEGILNEENNKNE